MMTVKPIPGMASSTLSGNKNNLNLVLFAFVFLLVPSFFSVIHAADSMWHSQFDWSRGVGVTPSESCNNAVEKHNKTVTNPLAMVRVTLVEKSPGTAGQYRCFWCQANNNCPDVAFSANRDTRSCPPGTKYDDTIDDCTNAMQKGAPVYVCPSSQAGNPIDFSIGNKFQVEDDFDGGELSFSRAYNSLDGSWRHSYSTKLRISSPYIALVFDDGREVLFYKPGDNPITPAGEFGVLAKSAEQWTYTSSANEVFRFNSEGLLTRIDKPYGYVQLSYVGGRVEVVDHLGEQLSFTAREDGQPLSLQAKGWQFQYTYDANSNLIKVTRQKDGLELAREYHYEDSRNSRLLTGITDERGIRFATWSYDDQGRAISSEHAGGVERINITYNADGTTTVVNELGKSANYKFAFVYGIKKIIEINGEPSPNCIASNAKFSYNSLGLLAQIINNKGSRTSFYYNNRGLEVQRSEVANTSQARTIFTEWHPTLPLPIKVTEPTRITTYTYDARGWQVGKSVTQR